MPEDIKIKGKPDAWGRNEILLLAAISAADEAAAIKLWNSLAPRRWRGLLEAPAFESRAAIEGSPVFWFDIRQQRWGLALRGWIVQSAVTDAVAAVTQNAIARFTAMTDQLLAGGVSIAEWQSDIADQIKWLIIAQYMAGNGGQDMFSPDDQQTIEDQLEFQYDRLAHFAQQIGAQRKLIATPDKVLSRISLYPQVAQHAFALGMRIGHEENGFDEERRILHPAEHCRDCPGLAARGWVPIGTLPDIGVGTECSFNCKCSFEFRRSRDAVP